MKNRSTLKNAINQQLKKNCGKNTKKNSSSAASNEPSLVANQCGVQKTQQ
jgi:hypothetical protein